MSGKLKFVAYPTTNERPTKRARSRRACSQCRHKKRRCSHQGNSNSTESTSPSRNLIWMESQTAPRETSESPSGQQLHENSENTQNDDCSTQGLGQESQIETCTSETHTSPMATRFVGDLNPEARLLDKTTTPEDAQNMAPGEVGVWVQPHVCEKCGSGFESCSPSSRPRRPSRTRMNRSHPPVSDILSAETTRILSKVYFANIHPMLPLLNEEQYWQNLSRAMISVPLVHVVCLLAAKDATAEKHLRLLHSGDTLISAREFCSQLYESVLSALTRRDSLGKITLMRILGLLSLHQEGKEGMEGASSCISQATHCAQSLALHLPRPHDDENEMKRIFWCLWILDRLNSATNSRPCMMADVDIGVPELLPGESGSVAFDVCFRIVKMLNTVIGLYRPNNTLSGWDTDFPAFEQILDEMHAWDLRPVTICVWKRLRLFLAQIQSANIFSTTATLQIFYSATAILAHRLKTITTLPSPTPSRIRQQLFATNVIRSLQAPEKLKELHPFPIVIYATSLALSVSYQQLRYSRLPSDQEAARQDFNAACDILQELRRKWSAADAIAALAHQISLALDRLPNLEVLRLNRSELTDRENPQNSTREYANSAKDAYQQIAETQIVDSSSQLGDENYFQNHTELFAGMDDVSWMYLDAENPVNFESLLPMNFHEPLPW